MMLIIFSDNQVNKEGKTYNEIVYVQEGDATAEQWNGKRLGVNGTKELLGFDMAFNGSDFTNIPVDFKAFDMVTFFDFNNDYQDKRGNTDLLNLIKTFKEKIDYSPEKKQLYSLIETVNSENKANVCKP